VKVGTGNSDSATVEVVLRAFELTRVDRAMSISPVFSWLVTATESGSTL